jgi:hypothetical protein
MGVPGIEPLLSGSGGTIQKHGYGTQLVQFLLCLTHTRPQALLTSKRYKHGVTKTH